ncbi:MYXO-CTERM sorting domain-containing protein [Chondromyces crocatus]|uniref:MYXO-CTERM sorting domain-containing protein n=1 Tax=Chondromyces crocatus TaxID=52 RepID=UPI0014706FFF|nr:MYXO-CTERM sorting domain-containing protein [Chondromyces crocatus]
MSLAIAPAAAWAWTPLAVEDDPLVRMPGTQPDQGLILEASASCMDCHADFDPNIESGFTWRGSMMAQAGRDPFFWAAMTVAAQDSIWAFGRPNAADLCERCHMIGGWLGGRSDPPNGSMMAGRDFDGVQCDGCHRMFDPFFSATAAGLREGDDWSGYWGESGMSSTPSQAAAALAQTRDATEAQAITLFNGAPAYDAQNQPALPGYTENASGQYHVAADIRKRGPYADAVSPHSTGYSRYHKSKFFCSTCHDVSNSALANRAFTATTPGDGATVLPSEEQSAFAYHGVERTFSEFMLSDYGQPGGAPGIGPYEPSSFVTSRPGNVIATCQDCHMPQRTGPGCDEFDARIRPTESVEHPLGGQGIHDLTGGNAFIPWILASTVPTSPNYDPENASLLRQGPNALTLDLDAGLGLDPHALLAASNRAVMQLKRAAAIEQLAYDPATGALSFRIQNHTGHKLITGYPEGRRMFVGVRLYQGANLLHEVNPYDGAAGTLKGLAGSPGSPALGAAESHDDALVYEAHSSSNLTGQDHTFHFVLATGMHKDNRIPPRGFRVAEAAARQAEPHWAGAAAPSHFTAAEYAGGHDDVSITLPQGGDRVVVALYYQTTSREYMEFLRDQINGNGGTLASPTLSGEPQAYVAQTDPFFAKLRLWGDTIWNLWLHNKQVPGAAPVLMTQALLAMPTCQGQPNGTPCEDGNLCTTGDTCVNGACVGGGMPDCNDQNPCTDDACDPQLGCVVEHNTQPCEDGDLCHGPEVCAFGVCVTGPQIYCYDGDPCTDDTCDPAIGCALTNICGEGGAGGAGGAPGTGGMSAGGAGGTSDGGAGGSTSTAGGSAPAAPDEGGCGCSTPGTGGAAGAAGGGALALLALLGLRSRRTRRPA